VCTSDDVYAYLHDGDAPEVANPDQGNCLQPSTSHVQSSLPTPTDFNSHRSLYDEQNSEMKVPAKKAKIVSSSTVVKRTTVADKVDKEIRHAEGISDPSSRWTQLSVSSSAASSQVSSFSETSDSQSSSQVPIDVGKEDFLLRPGSFRILLCVDNQEFYAKYYTTFYIIRTL